MKKTLLEKENAIIELYENIILATWKDEIIDIIIAKTAVENRLEATGGKKYPMLINMKSVKTISKEARDFLASEPGCEGVIAAAIIIDSAINSMIANFFLYVTKPPIPTKIFGDEEDAMQWLRQYVK